MHKLQIFNFFPKSIGHFLTLLFNSLSLSICFLQLFALFLQIPRQALISFHQFRINLKQFFFLTFQNPHCPLQSLQLLHIFLLMLIQPFLRFIQFPA